MHTDTSSHTRSISRGQLQAIRAAVQDQGRISGLTHSFYKYPARFSPAFASEVIKQFSEPGDVVLDPFMGGGTSIVEAMAHARQAIGCDINPLAVFVTRVKTTVLTGGERDAVWEWIEEVVPCLHYQRVGDLRAARHDGRSTHLGYPETRPIKKLIALALASLASQLPTERTRSFVRCGLLRLGQLTLDGKRNRTTAETFRAKLTLRLQQMLSEMREFERVTCGHVSRAPILFEGSARTQLSRVSEGSVDLVVSSPPYPGVNILYHRWQIRGRRETTAPYWIIDRPSPASAVTCTIAGRHTRYMDRYLPILLQNLQAIRSTMRTHAVFAQLVGLKDVDLDLVRYREVVRRAGFAEVGIHSADIIRRTVPGRSWYTQVNRGLDTAVEFVLLHRAR